MPIDEYLTTEELGCRIKMAQGTIRNLVWKGELVERVHFIKPTPRKILFIWPAVKAWLHSSGRPGNKSRSLINI